MEEFFIGFEGAFKIFDESGLPLSMIMDGCEKSGLRVALDCFVRDAVRAGWSVKKAFAVVEEAVSERHGAVKGMEIRAKLEAHMFGNQETYWPEIKDNKIEN